MKERKKKKHTLVKFIRPHVQICESFETNSKRKYNRDGKEIYLWQEKDGEAVERMYFLQ